MQKTAPTLGRIMVMVVFALSCFGLLLFLWLAFGGSIPLAPKGYRFYVEFPEATQLAQQADVRVSGVPVGKVISLKPDEKTGLTRAQIQLQTRYAPVSRDTRAILRAKTLLGETYVELSPGLHADRRHALPEGGTLPHSNVSSTVQLDEIYRTFDAKTRAAFRAWLQSQSRALEPYGPEINDALGNLVPFATDTTSLLGVLDSQRVAVRRLVRDTGRVFGALSARHGELRSLIRTSNQVFAATAREQQALSATFRVFPTFQRESRATLRALDRYAQNTNPVITELRPAARQLSPTLKSLARLAPQLQGLFVGLDPLITASRTGLPALDTFLDKSRPALAELDPTLRQLTPALRFLGLYKRDLVAFFANSAAVTQGTASSAGVPLHYTRIETPVSPESLAVYPRRLGGTRPNPYQAPGGALGLKTRGYLQVFDTRACGAINPAPVADQPGLSASLNDGLRHYYWSGGTQAQRYLDGKYLAPLCSKQPALGPLTGFGSSDFPHITSDPPAR